MDTDRRNLDLQNLQSYLQTVDKEVTMVLQSLQWDRKHLLEGKDLVSCSLDPNHKIPPDKKEEHERKCILPSHGYSRDDDFLPEPVDPHAPTLIKHSKMEIQRILQNASNSAPSFRMGGGGPESPEPLTAARLQATYSAEQRRAIHDAVVAAAPDLADIGDLTLLSVEERSQARARSKLELLAQLRDMKRRRARYRGAAGSTRYSDVLRDLINTQMELYTGVKNEPAVDNARIGINAPTDNNKAHSDYEHGNIPIEPDQNNKDRECDYKKSETSKETNMYAKAEIRTRDRNEDTYYRRNSSKDRNYESYTKETSSKKSRADESYKNDRSYYRNDRGYYRNDYDYNSSACSSYHSRSNRYGDHDDKQRHKTKSYSKTRREHSRDRDRSRVRVKVESSPSRSSEQNVYIKEDTKSRHEQSDRRPKDSKEYSKNKNHKSYVETNPSTSKEQTVYIQEANKSRHDNKRNEDSNEDSRRKKKKHKSHKNKGDRDRNVDFDTEIKQEPYTRYYDC